ncbi:trichodiene synthase family protein [Pleurotus pulmonarius]
MGSEVGSQASRAQSENLKLLTMNQEIRRIRMPPLMAASWSPHPGSPLFAPSSRAASSLHVLHMESLSARMYIALYTSLATYVDDVYDDQPNLVNAFCHNFVMHLPQETAVLRAFDQLLRETSNHFDGIQANFIIASTMYFMNGVVLEHDIRPLEIKTSNLPQFLRGLSGDSFSFCIFIFPKDVPLNSYIQALPSMMDYVDYMNDVLSFYKEEVNGEDQNIISILSMQHGVPKTVILEQLADQVASNYVSANDILRTSSDAAQADWRRFARGYVSFHVSYGTRYRLHEVFQGSEDSTS